MNLKWNRSAFLVAKALKSIMGKNMRGTLLNSKVIYRVIISKDYAGTFAQAKKEENVYQHLKGLLSFHASHSIFGVLNFWHFSTYTGILQSGAPTLPIIHLPCQLYRLRSGDNFSQGPLVSFMAEQEFDTGPSLSKVKTLCTHT